MRTTTEAPRVPTGVLHALAVTPAVLVSAVITIEIGAILAPLPGLVLFVAVVVATLLSARGAAEPAAVRLLCRGRVLPGPDHATLAPVLTLLRRHGIDPAGLDLYVRADRPGVGAEALGLRSVVLTQALVHAVRAAHVSPEAAAAVLAAAIGRVHLGHSRHDVLLELWTIPWQLIGIAVAAVSRCGRWIPLAQVAWRLRFVVATVAVVQTWTAGHPVLAGVIAAFIALTYLTPRWHTSWTRRTHDEADQFVRQHGLTPPRTDHDLAGSRLGRPC